MTSVLQLFTASSGFQSARIIREDSTICHLHSTVKPESEADYFENVHFWGDVLVFTGIGLGYHVYKKIQTIPSSITIVVIDYYNELLEICSKSIFHTLSNPIFMISHGNHTKELSKLCQTLKYLTSPSIQVVKHPASYYLHKKFYDNILNQIGSMKKQSTFLNTEGKKVLLFYGSFFLQEEIRRALFTQTGVKPVLFFYEKSASAIDFECNLQKIIQIEKPDCIISVNMKGFDGNGILHDIISRFSIPLVVWFVDDPFPILLHHKQFINPLMIALCWEKKYLNYLKQCGFGKVVYVPLATDPELFSGSSKPTTSIPLGFVGSSMGEAFLQDIMSKFLWDNALQHVVEEVSEIILAQTGISVFKTIKNMAEKLCIPIPFSDTRNMTWLCSYCIHYASMKKRKRIIQSLIENGIETFGDPKGWYNLCGSAVKTNPEIDYTTKLCEMYQSIIININITSCQMPSAVNQRVFDVPMSGSFLLTDNQADVSQLFAIGKEVILYTTIEDLKEKFYFYVENEEARKKCILAAQKRITKEHTYKHRIKSIISLVFSSHRKSRGCCEIV